mmetsp:Transcript_36843/g.102241  ORF Transcript_36843/g.102241 Transcript_36843/m.102241 type:complete len:417 (-) Transcript_36843:119-1369(-)
MHHGPLLGMILALLSFYCASAMALNVARTAQDLQLLQMPQTRVSYGAEGRHPEGIQRRASSLIQRNTTPNESNHTVEILSLSVAEDHATVQKLWTQNSTPQAVPMGGDAATSHGKQQATLPVPYLWLRLAICGLFVGSVFGMMGAGGAMITKPMLYFIFNVRPFKLTIFNMYVILFFLAFFGAAMGCRKGLVVWPHVAVLFLFTSMLGTTVGAVAAQFISSNLQLVAFAVLIAVLAVYIWCAVSFPARKAEGQRAGQKGPPAEWPHEQQGSKETAAAFTQVGKHLYFASVATCVGCLVGSLGVGGGFMLTPLLCHIGHGMDTAAPTSLAVIALSSSVGAAWYSSLFGLSFSSLDPTVTAGLVLLGCLGIAASGRLASLMTSSLRQKIYASLLLALGCGTLYAQTWGNEPAATHLKG